MSSPIKYSTSDSTTAELRSDTLILERTRCSITSLGTDPTSVSHSADQGSIFMASADGKIYVKQDNGDTTNWLPVALVADLGAQTYRAESTSVTAALNDFLVVDASGGAITITLPAAGTAGAKITIKKNDSSTNGVTVDGDSAETIDGVANFILSSEDESIVVVDNGTNWDVENRYIPNTWLEANGTSTAFTVTAGQWGDQASLIIPPGTWEISTFVAWIATGATTTSFIQMGLSTTSGNVAPSPEPDAVIANHADHGGASGSRSNMLAAPTQRTVTTATTYYMKVQAGTSIANLSIAWKFSAKKVA